MESELTDFLKTMAEMRKTMGKGVNGYYSVEEFILKYGQWFEPQPLPKRFTPGEIKHCYRNAALLAVAKKDLVYCEGYAMGVIPVMHAWLVDQQGRVVDPTWHKGTAYFGIPIKLEYLEKRLLVQSRYGLI